MRRVLFILIGALVFGCASEKTAAPALKTKHANTAQEASEQKSEVFFGGDAFVQISAGSYQYPIGLKTKATKVTLTKPFFMKRTEVTQQEWFKLMGTSPSQNAKCEQCPVERVSWLDAVKFANRVSKFEKRDPCYQDDGTPNFDTIYECKGYRLPTEAEWVFVAQQAVSQQLSDDDAWLVSNSKKRTHAVGKKLANKLGLFDLYGNVWEWCHDWYAELPQGHSIDPQGPKAGKMRVSRGGSWRSPKTDLTAFRPRYSHLPTSLSTTRGFRLVRQAN